MELKIFKIASYIALIAGSLMIIGTIFKWKFLVDPPEELAAVYSHSRLKKWFGTEFLIFFNYFLGTLFILIALFFLCKIYTGTLKLE